eukprot:jgi/Mesen1/1321/ME000013S00819
MKEGCSTRKNLLVVIGGRGKLGLVMIKAAMAASHKVTAFVEDAELLRDPVTGKLPSGLAVILGCPSKEVALVAVLKVGGAIASLPRMPPPSLSPPRAAELASFPPHGKRQATQSCVCK